MEPVGTTSTIRTARIAARLTKGDCAHEQFDIM